jgi:hypothetical protein
VVGYLQDRTSQPGAELREQALFSLLLDIAGKEEGGAASALMNRRS